MTTDQRFIKGHVIVQFAKCPTCGYMTRFTKVQNCPHCKVTMVLEDIDTTERHRKRYRTAKFNEHPRIQVVRTPK